MTRCERCGYFWIDEGEQYGCCHYADPWPAPCEYDDVIEEEEDAW